MLVGIYSNHFLGVYHQRSKNLECFNCGLISPKNYIIECKHCICQNCLSTKKFCSKCKNQKIIITGDDATAFQFIVTEIMLYPYEMKCIFNSCNWTGTYQDFIKYHYKECNNKKGKKIYNEYFEEFKINDYKRSNYYNKRSKSEFKTIRKPKNKIIQLYDSDEEEEEENNIDKNKIINYEINNNNNNYTKNKINKELKLDEKMYNNNKIKNEEIEVIDLKDYEFHSSNYICINNNNNKKDEEIFLEVPEKYFSKYNKSQKHDEIIYLNDDDDDKENEENYSEVEEIYEENEEEENKEFYKIEKNSDNNKQESESGISINEEEEENEDEESYSDKKEDNDYLEEKNNYLKMKRKYEYDIEDKLFESLKRTKKFFY